MVTAGVSSPRHEAWQIGTRQPSPGAKNFRRQTKRTPHTLAPSTFSPARGTSHLPSEIGFLAHYGVSFVRLANAVETARRQGVTADRVLIAEGQISEDYFYRALARHLRLTFIDADVALKAAAPYPQMIEAGAVALAPGQGAAFLTAPRGHGDRPFDRRLEPAWAGYQYRSYDTVTLVTTRSPSCAPRHRARREL